MYNKHNQYKKTEEDDAPKIDLSKAEKFLSMTFEAEVLGDLQYIISGNVVTILAGGLTEQELYDTLRENYSLLLSILQNDELELEVDLGYFVMPLSLKDLKEITKLSL